MRLLHSRLAFRCGIAFDMMECIYEGDLQLDLLAAKRGVWWLGHNLVKRAGELSRRLN
jgi:hypothetical protein